MDVLVSKFSKFRFFPGAADPLTTSWTVDIRAFMVWHKRFKDCLLLLDWVTSRHAC